MFKLTTKYYFSSTFMNSNSEGHEFEHTHCGMDEHGK